ncbi:MAG: DNA repair protein RecN [Clostridia bacterium]|nr:DNA repair protein RecN [Clostridia bacterium]
MLASLHIENIAVIKKLDADFSSGFTVLTGETGAGKSILIDSIAFLLGAKPHRELIRTGESKALVSGFFTDLSKDMIDFLATYDIEPEDDGSVTLVKTLSSEGKTTVKINGRTVSATVARNCGMGLINIHGQHDNQVLQNAANHITYLDRYAENDELLDAYGKEYRLYRDAENEVLRLMEKDRDKERLRELLLYQIQDIESADLHEGEEEELLNRKKLIQNAKQLSKHILTAYRALYKNSKGMSASQLVEFAVESTSQLSELIPEAEALSERLSDIQSEIEEIAKQVSSFMPSDLDDPEKELEEIGDRLDIIRKLKRKYGSSITEVLAFLEKAKFSLTEIEESDERIESLSAFIKKQQKNVSALAETLHRRRVEKGLELSQKICQVLQYLDMGKVLFSVSVTPKDDESFTLNGYDAVEFYIATNPGEPMKPLTKIASGGELSRIMLAIKCVLADAEAVPSIIFDEVDTGVSGKTSQKIGLKLHELAFSTQVICITHSAQIAAVADHHFKICKDEIDGRVETKLNLLNREGRVGELARIISGVSITEKTKETALEMLENAHSDVSLT